MFCFRWTLCVCKHKKTILSYRMGQKLSSKLLFIYSSNSDGFYIFYISQGSVATQLRCDGMFSNHFITNFPQNAPVEKFSQLVNIWQRYGQNYVNFFGQPVYFAYMRAKTPWRIDPDFCGGRYPRRNHVFQIWWRSVQAFSVGWGSNFAIPHWLCRSSLKLSHYRVSVWYRACLQTYDTIGEFNVDSKAECDRLNLAHETKVKKTPMPT